VAYITPSIAVAYTSMNMALYVVII